MVLGFGEGVIEVLFNYIAVIVIQLCEYENWMYPLRNNKVKIEIIKLHYMHIYKPLYIYIWLYFYKTQKTNLYWSLEFEQNLLRWNFKS